MAFKVIFLTAFAGAFTIAVVSARRAAARHGGRLNQIQREVRGLVVVRAVLGLVFYTALAVWLTGIRDFAWTYVGVPLSVRWTAAALLVLALVFFALSHFALGTNYRGGVGLYDAHELVTSGPYRYLRHPIYAAFIAIMVCVGPMSTSWLLGLSGLILVLSIAVARVPIEEAQLRERFVKRWEDYRARTAAFVPGVPWRGPK